MSEKHTRTIGEVVEVVYAVKYLDSDQRPGATSHNETVMYAALRRVCTKPEMIEGRNRSIKKSGDIYT